MKYFLSICFFLICFSNLYSQSHDEKITSIAFKSQQYCRAEVKDFEYDARFSVVSATIYFSGANFKNVEKGTITSNNLEPVKKLMERCIPGSVVTFDDVKVIGPDNEVRTIAGTTFRLH